MNNEARTRAVSSSRAFRSLDGQAVAAGRLVEPDDAVAVGAAASGDAIIGRGSGVCFVGASFGEDVLAVSASRLREVGQPDGDSMQIRVGAGVTLAELYAATVPRSVYLPALPGHPQISVGGCIACNVHGKNPAADGCFIDHVESIELFHPDHGHLVASRSENPEVFELTCGGYGLTGVITAATLRLRPLPSPFVEIEKHPVGDLRETIERLDHFADDYEFGYSWNDFSRFDERLGRGYVAVAHFREGHAAPLRDPDHYPRHDPSRKAVRPRVFRPVVVPAVTTINRLWEMWRPRAIVELFDFCFPGMGFRNAWYYDWYGSQGMLAHMVIVARSAVDDYVASFERILRKHRVPLLVSAVKRFEGVQRLLRFDGSGVSLHLHIPNDAAGRALAEDLERLAGDHGAVRAIYVESRLTETDARSLYPEWQLFRDRLHAYDPRRRFQSALSIRLGL